MRLIVASLIAFVALAVMIAPAVAANPPGTGQPASHARSNQAVLLASIQRDSLTLRPSMPTWTGRTGCRSTTSPASRSHSTS